MSIPDPVEEIRALLLADANVAGMVSDRVGHEVPEDDTPNMPRACVVVKPAGGPGRLGMLAVRNTRIDTLCYGTTLKEAEQLHRYVREVLETMDRPTETLFSAQITADGATLRDPTTQWPLSIASYLVLSATDP